MKTFEITPLEIKVQGECAFCGAVGRWTVCVGGDEQEDTVCDDCLSDYEDGLL